MSNVLYKPQINYKDLVAIERLNGGCFFFLTRLVKHFDLLPFSLSYSNLILDCAHIAIFNNNSVYHFDAI